MSDEKRDDAPAPRRPPTHSSFESVIDQLLSKARSQGHFDHLEGKGRPLERDDDSLVPEDARAAFRMLKNAGFAPAWIEARRALEAERAALGVWLLRANERWPRLAGAEREKLRAEYRGKLEALRREILSHNLSCPESAGQIPGVRVDVELARLGAADE